MVLWRAEGVPRSSSEGLTSGLHVGFVGRAFFEDTAVRRAEGSPRSSVRLFRSESCCRRSHGAFRGKALQRASTASTSSSTFRGDATSMRTSSRVSTSRASPGSLRRSWRVPSGPTRRSGCRFGGRPRGSRTAPRGALVVESDGEAGGAWGTAAPVPEASAGEPCDLLRGGSLHDVTLPASRPGSSCS